MNHGVMEFQTLRSVMIRMKIEVDENICEDDSQNCEPLVLQKCILRLKGASLAACFLFLGPVVTVRPNAMHLTV